MQNIGSAVMDGMRICAYSKSVSNFVLIGQFKLLLGKTVV